MMKQLLIIPMLFISTLMFAQTETKPETLTVDLETMQLYEDSLGQILDTIKMSRTETVRREACYQLIPTLVRSLKSKNSFNYPFDSLKTKFSVVNSPDNKFRIFTWLMVLDEGVFRYYGAIQFNNSDSLQLVGLVDKSSETSGPEYRELAPDNWYGALYYNISQHTTLDGSKTYYILYGWDSNNNRSDKKLADVLQFDDTGKVTFGAPIFEMLPGMGSKGAYHRFILEFKDGAIVTLNYDQERQKMLFDFLKDEGGSGAGNARIPDGTYQAFEFKGDMWRHVDKVFDEVLETAPRPKPVLGAAGAEAAKNKKKKKGKKKKKKNKK